MTTKTKIMKCINCRHDLNGFCTLLRKDVSPLYYCGMFNELPDETLDSGNDVEFGVDIDLKENESLDGDDEENWTPVVPYRAK